MVIPPTVNATTYSFNAGRWKLELPITVVAQGLGATESVTIEISADGGTTWQGIYTLTSTGPAVTITGPGLYRINKPATAGAVGVEVMV